MSRCLLLAAVCYCYNWLSHRTTGLDMQVMHHQRRQAGERQLCTQAHMQQLHDLLSPDFSPVGATASSSRPASRQGMAWRWMGVGSPYVLAARASSTRPSARGARDLKRAPSSRQLRRGAGMSVPCTCVGENSGTLGALQYCKCGLLCRTALGGPARTPSKSTINQLIHCILIVRHKQQAAPSTALGRQYTFTHASTPSLCRLACMR